MTIAHTVFANHADASRHVADLIAALVHDQPNCTLGLATGGTPVEVYQDLRRRHRADLLSFQNVTTYNLDEYLGLPVGHSQSYRAFMNEQLFDHIDIDLTRTHLPDVQRICGDVTAERVAADYESEIVGCGGIDLQLLGIGANGHIGFNEPGSTRDSVTRVVGLAESTIQANARFFDDPKNVPRRAITMGIRTILRAKRIVLLATGQSKAAAVARTICGPISPDNPASFLQTHSDALIVCDSAAASAIA